MSCIVCGSKITHKVFDPGPQPLAALNLPRSAEAAHDALRFPMNFRMCAFCGHVFNADFNYTQIPYAEDSNLMYNSGLLWQNHMQQTIDLLRVYQNRWLSGTAIDIGCGDGQFFNRLLSTFPAHCVGYEPGIDAAKIQHFSVIRDYFIPERDLKRFKPTLLVCRHVIEHMDAPRDFVAEIAYWCGVYDLNPMFLVEVPCFDKSLLTCQASDFLYEHVSNFTTHSFRTLFSLADYSELGFNCYYGGEVLTGLFEPKRGLVQVHAKAAQDFGDVMGNSIALVQAQLQTFPELLFWGGTGKSAAFLNMYGLDSKRYPFVVDSDPCKVGKYVPGTGQEIRRPEDFKANENLVIVITTPWRAADIKMDIEHRGLKYSKLLVLQEGALHDYCG